MDGFSRREFRNREAVYTDALGQSIPLSFSRREFRNREAGRDHLKSQPRGPLQSARIQES